MTAIIHKPGPVPEPMPIWPLPPEDIIEGKPDSRGMVLVESADGKLGCGQWRCTPGKFRCEYTVDEFFWVRDGEIHLSIEGGETVTLHAGDTAYLPTGTVAIWHVIRAVHKVFFFHRV